MKAGKRRFMAVMGMLALSGPLVLPAPAQRTPDFAQAVAMLDLLRSCAAGEATPARLDQVLSLPGTELIVRQQNISRRVTIEQYREVLQAGCRGEIARVKPAEPGIRAEKGVRGLTEDVAPSLIWGRDHVPLLEARLARLRGNRSIRDPIPRVRKYLPTASKPVELNPRLLVVMGGRAGGAAIENQLYYDLLIMEWRAARGEVPPTSAQQVGEFFAHETHHLGYGQILDRQKDSMTLTPGEDQAWELLQSVMMEGSATLLINGHGRLADLRKQPEVARSLAQAPELLARMEALLRRALQSPLSDEDYAQAESPFLNMGYHATGALLLAAIEQRRGLRGVMEVMADPRRLLVAYNDCAGQSTAVFRFDPSLAEQVAGIGEARAN